MHINGVSKVVLAFVLSSCVYAADKSNQETIYTEDKLGIAVKIAQPEFVIKLKSNPTTGYSWFLRDYDTHFMSPVKHVFQPSTNKKLMGAPGFDIWTFKVKPAAFIVPQQTTVRFVYSRPWEGVDQATQVVFRVSTLSKE